MKSRATSLNFRAGAPFFFAVFVAWAECPGQERGSRAAARLKENAATALERGRNRVYDWLSKVEPERHAHWITAWNLRAWLAAGGWTSDARIKTLLDLHADAVDPPDVETAYHRLELRLLPGGSSLDQLQRGCREIIELQSSDGMFRSSDDVPREQRADDAALTARVGSALLRARQGVDLSEKVLLDALQSTLRCQRSDGGVGDRRAGSRSNAAATAACLTWWMQVAAESPDDEDLRERLEKALDRAELWMRDKARVGRNVGSRSEVLSWLCDGARAQRQSLWPPPPPSDAAARIDGHLATYQLPDYGWNHRASLNDVHGGNNNDGTGQGATRGMGISITIGFDEFDTPAATVALSPIQPPDDAGMAYALNRRLGSRKRLPPRETWDELADWVRLRRNGAVPVLLERIGDGDVAIRMCAHHLLQRITEKDFGYAPRQKPENKNNVAALRAWQEWWER